MEHASVTVSATFIIWFGCDSCWGSAWTYTIRGRCPQVRSPNVPMSRRFHHGLGHKYELREFRSKFEMPANDARHLPGKCTRCNNPQSIYFVIASGESIYMTKHRQAKYFPSDFTFIVVVGIILDHQFPVQTLPRSNINAFTILFDSRRDDEIIFSFLPLTASNQPLFCRIDFHSVRAFSWSNRIIPNNFVWDI